MKLSHYTKVYPYMNEPGSVVLYSTLTGSVILIGEDLYERALSDELSPDEQETLSGQGFLVKDADSERQEVFKLLNNMNDNNTRFDLIAVMNLDCNLACVYCYEGDMKGKLNMTGDTAAHLTDFISRNLSPGTQTLNIDFYGGEPLLSLDMIKVISIKLKALADGKGMTYGFTLVTNGTLFTRKVAEELALFGLRGVKITLDGPEENHDKHRPYKSGAGSFERIVTNIKETCELINIGIGGNYSRENYRKFPELLDYLIAEGLTPEKIKNVKFDPIMKADNPSAPADFRDGCESANEPWLVGASLYLREEILKRGFNTPEITANTCLVNIQDSYVVNYDGSIYKCPGLIGKEGFEVGNVRDGATDYDYGKAYNPGMWKNDKCADCEYLPLCFGGCRYLKYIQDGNIDGVECKKEYFDATFEEFIMQDIKYRLAQ